MNKYTLHRFLCLSAHRGLTGAWSFKVNGHPSSSWEEQVVTQEGKGEGTFGAQRNISSSMRSSTATQCAVRAAQPQGRLFSCIVFSDHQHHRRATHASTTLATFDLDPPAAACSRTSVAWALGILVSGPEPRKQSRRRGCGSALGACSHTSENRARREGEKREEKAGEEKAEDNAQTCKETQALVV
ncbi:hypothetical protein FA13DRAFT_827266 [Coprinellus micaceus]|uniref:Uncharacterized protein n=1 Tax=Coprinellus micaceus TaxID=71717 RepID=A0A4Y7T1K2_COPMI|nr:hypothetical protein FA13DRAFT_827266 [Coprinellus micaceus]